jgi:hypothetical protein
MSVYTIANKRVVNFIKDNEDSNVIIQLKQANEKRDREAFVQLIAEIREIIRLQDMIEGLQYDIEYRKQEIKDTKRLVAEIENKVKNGLNYHKIKRGAK